MAQKSEKSALRFPKEIIEFAENSRKQRLDRKRREEEKRKAKEKENKLTQRRRLKAGLKYAEKVFGWAEAFRKSDVGQELMRVSHIPTAYSSIFFFDGHIEGVNWVGLVVAPEGLFLNSGGRYSALTRKQVNSASDLARYVDTRILQSACQWIEDGRVWECIQRRFDYLKKYDRAD